MSGFVNAMLDGMQSGILLTFLIGPVFFALLQTSIEKGFKKGVHFAFGVVSSDALIFLILLFGLSQLPEEQSGSIYSWIGLIGGIILIGFGIQLMRKIPVIKNINNQEITKSKNNFNKAFVMNGLNPFVFFYWMAIISNTGSINTTKSNETILIFFLSCMTVVLVSDIVKAFLAQKLQKIITPIRMLWLNRVTGFALLLGGLKVLIKAVELKHLTFFI
jgi:threonine/homoserine/homoserine lactone efflux protein